MLFCERGWEDCLAVRPSMLDCFAVMPSEARLLSFSVGWQGEENIVYLLYLDESGVHIGSQALILAGVAIQEQDVWHLQRHLDRLLHSKLPKGLNPLDFELHATEIKSPIRMVRGKKVVSNWAQVPVGTRFNILRATYGGLANFTCQDPLYPCALFGAVVDRSYSDREQRAYEEVLHKFDEMLTRQAHVSGTHQRGMVIHDRRVIEKNVQGWVSTWRRIAGRIGKLTHIADVPLFADSRASRLIQAADFVSWGLYRFYGEAKDERWIKPLWMRFDSEGNVMHGLIHVSPGFHKCACPPCASRHAQKTDPPDPAD